MKKALAILRLFLAAALLLAAVPALGEGEPDLPPPEAEEAALEEIRGILEIHPVENMEGMDLETLTETLAESAMAEYYDPVSGFRMQYPSFLQFDEENTGAAARSEDGRVTMAIGSTPDGKQLTGRILMEAVRMEEPSGEIREYTDPACILRETLSGGTFRVDMYVLAGDWLHHVVLMCPEEARDSVAPYIEYMVHSVTTDGVEAG